MAGIAGILGQNSHTETAKQMLRTIAHRGPDETATCQVGQLALAVGAAALSAARGSGLARGGDAAVAFDGEIYNPRPQGTADAQVVLEAYRKHGRTFAAHLKGVFACAVFDGQELLLARDSVGVRPMYWGRTPNGNVAFASEAKALVGVSDNVQELPPATTWSSRSGLAAYVPQYPPTSVPSSLEEAAARLRETLTAAVARRLEDGAVGACLLSGGLDSSVIAVTAYELGARVPLVTVGLEGAPDLANARIVAEHLRAEHVVELYTPEQIGQMVPRAVWALESFDEDCVSGAVSSLFASAAASELTNCILSGEGGDELFGGYHLLKDLPTEAERLRMMGRLIEVAYNTAVQRLDRAMFANGITYRTPFIDTDLIALALQLPVSWKIHQSGSGELVEKFILREAFRDLLPGAIYRRPKLRFSAGTGTDGLMDRIAQGHVSRQDFDRAGNPTPEGYVRSSPKELWYYRLFKERFPAACFERLVGRWDPGKQPQLRSDPLVKS